MAATQESAVLLVVSLLACLKGKKSGKGISIAGIVVSVASITIGWRWAFSLTNWL